ncbi:hypothetical protein OOU_Y34scaffold00140g86 [Pyricularia oryzae Y34]|uniref:Uncharacterized protein n=1 Tax=Pyricularia oryzae (strain Y34) TaxID=1143189 RepID=A0AA97P815_PYRO3|nr:hypothetical protein OOU_Y34scaffold00140g86 [Pyricularia oryzae Y34]
MPAVGPRYKKTAGHVLPRRCPTCISLTLLKRTISSSHYYYYYYYYYYY